MGYGRGVVLRRSPADFITWSMSVGRRNAGWATVGGLTLLLGLAPGRAEAGSVVEDRVMEGLQRGRIRAGAAELDRLASLDEVARERAAIIAALPHSDRLAYDEPLAPDFQALGIKVARSSIHLDMVRGYTDPAAAFLRTWRSYQQSWTTAMDPELERIGLAAERGDDGWIVLVAVQITELPIPDDLSEIATRAFRAINDVRREHGLIALVHSAALDELARDHSEDMARQQYFAHRSRSGLEVDGRAELVGVEFQRIGENIRKNRGHRDPVAVAVESWMNSKGHREAILSPHFVRSGVGVAVDDEGAVYFTQVFLTPRAGT